MKRKLSEPAADLHQRETDSERSLTGEFSEVVSSARSRARLGSVWCQSHVNPKPQIGYDSTWDPATDNGFSARTHGHDLPHAPETFASNRWRPRLPWGLQNLGSARVVGGFP